MTEVGVEEFAITVGKDRHVRARWRGNGEDGGELVIDDLRRRTIEVLIELLRGNRLTQKNELILLGEHLFVTLFGGLYEESFNGAGRLFKEAIGDVSTEDGEVSQLLRVALALEAGSGPLAAWPWEYLYVPEVLGDPNTGFFLLQRANFVLTRSLPLSARERVMNVSPPVKVLFVALSPRKMPRIEYTRVLEQLVRLRDQDSNSRIDLHVLADEHGPDGQKYENLDESEEPRTTWRSFLATVDRFQPHVIHIVGHGRYVNPGSQANSESDTGGQLAFRKSDHTPSWISDQTLAAQLMDVRTLRLVFLQACESAEVGAGNPYQVISGLAQWLASRNIPAVVAMHFKVENLLANEFACTFYENMAQRQPIEVAMHAARRQLMSGDEGETGRGGFGLPVLYLRGSGALLSPLESSPKRTVIGGRPSASGEYARVQFERVPMEVSVDLERPVGPQRDLGELHAAMEKLERAPREGGALRNAPSDRSAR